MHVRFFPSSSRLRWSSRRFQWRRTMAGAGNGEEEFELVGTVESGVSLAGPHATMKVRAEGGQVWDITLAPGSRTANAGLKEGVIPVGAQVTVHGHRSKDPKRFEIKTERVTWNGKTYNVYRTANRQHPHRSDAAQAHLTWPTCWRGSRVPPLATPCATPASGRTASSTCFTFLASRHSFGAVLVLDLRLMGSGAASRLAPSLGRQCQSQQPGLSSRRRAASA